jgi:ABC-2 type transport system permease protein
MTTTTLHVPQVRRGGRWWVDSYLAMLRYDVASMREWLAPFLMIQVFMGAGMAIMYGFYFDEVPRVFATFVSTGAPVLAIIPVGMTMVPSLVLQHRLDNTYDFVWSLPVPRMSAMVSNLTLFTAISAPGAAITLLVAAWRYDIDLAISWDIVPAVLLASIMGVAVGFGFAHAMKDPRMTNLVVNLIIFFVTLFSPIAFPIENFPDWFATVHRFLPFYPMAQVIREGLTSGLATDVGWSYAVLTAWTIIGWGTAARIVTRRR